MVWIQRFTLALAAAASCGISAGLVAQQENADDEQKQVGFPTATVFAELVWRDDGSIDIEDHALAEVGQLEQRIAELRVRLARKQEQIEIAEANQKRKKETTRGRLQEKIVRLRNKNVLASRTIWLCDSTLAGEQKGIDELAWAFAFHKNVNCENLATQKSRPEIQEEITTLKAQREVQSEIYADEHPIVLSIDQAIQSLDRRLKLADQVVSRSKGPRGVVRAAIERLKAEQRDRAKVMDSTRERLKAPGNGVSSIEISKNQTAAIRSDLQMKKIVLQAAKERLRVTPQMAPNFAIQTFTNSPEFLHLFAKKHQKLFQTEDVDALATELTQRIVIQSDKYDQRNVFRVSFRHDSRVFSKVVLKLLVPEIRRSIKLHPNPELQQLHESVGELEVELEATNEAIRNFTENAPPDELQKLKARKAILRQHYRDLTAKMEEASQVIPNSQSVAFQVLTSDWNLISEAELEEYNALRKKHRGLPKLEYVAPESDGKTEEER